MRRTQHKRGTGAQYRWRLREFSIPGNAFGKGCRVKQGPCPKTSRLAEKEQMVRSNPEEDTEIANGPLLCSHCTKRG